MGGVGVLASVAWLWALVVVIPGPNFLAAAQAAAVRGRASGLRTAAGMATGTCLWGLAGFFGVRSVFLAAPWLYAGLKLAGGAYLLLLGLRLLRGAARGGVVSAPPDAIPGAISGASGVRVGLMTCLSNPKTALFVTSLFAAVMPAGATDALGLGAVALMGVISAFWYALVACVLTTRAAGRAFLRLRRWIDGLAGLLFIGYGARLVLAR